MKRSTRGAPPPESVRRPAGPFRIHVVAEMTGVPEPTLRAWERRYGVPSPERTATGYRLYTMREVEQVRAMRAACDGGMSAAESARWVLAGGDRPDPPPPASLDPDAFARSRERILTAVDNLDDEALEANLRQVMYLGNATTILDEVLVPVLHEVGTRWSGGNLSIAHEHFASHRIATVLRDLVRLSSAPNSATTIILASFADDDHELGLLGLAVHLGTWGLRPLVLGARTPPSALRDAIATVKPAIVGLSVTIPPDPAHARELVDAYANACGTTPWVVGGFAVASVADFVRARGGAVDPGSLEKLRELISSTVDARRQGKKP